MFQMKVSYSAVIKQSGSWWIGWIEEVPGVNCQEPTKQELIETLKVTLQEALGFNRREAREAAGRILKKRQSPYETRRASSASPKQRLHATS